MFAEQSPKFVFCPSVKISRRKHSDATTKYFRPRMGHLKASCGVDHRYCLGATLKLCFQSSRISGNILMRSPSTVSSQTRNLRGHHICSGMHHCFITNSSTKLSTPPLGAIIGKLVALPPQLPRGRHLSYVSFINHQFRIPIAIILQQIRTLSANGFATIFWTTEGQHS